MTKTEGMAEKSVIIIGAGLAGLATGCYARMNGYRALILEHYSEPGGVAKAWRRNGYLIDGGVHYLMGHRPGLACHKLYRELGVFQGRKFPEGLWRKESFGASYNIKNCSLQLPPSKKP